MKLVNPRIGSYPDPLSKPLTPSELDVLGLVLKGKTNSEIAKIRRTETQTVKNQCSVIYKKLGVRDRIHAVIKGLAA